MYDYLVYLSIINGPLRQLQTRKPCCRTDDRAMRPVYESPENFRESLATPTATVPEIVNGLLLRSIVLKSVQNLKFVALPVPEIIGGTYKLWAVPGYAVQGHSKSLILVPIESVYATSY